MIKILVFILLLLSSSTVDAATYYIDYTSGSNSNNGTSPSTPWKHAPGMTGVSGNPASHTPAAGNSYILKGGETWPNVALGWLWTWSGDGTTASPGCAGNGCIYVGVDATWYSGAAWTRPKLDAGGSAVTATDGVANVLLRIYANYLIVDNLELTGLYWTGTPAYGSNVNVALPGGTPGIGTNITLENLYIHGWSHGTYASGTHEHPSGVIGDTGVPNNNVNSIIKMSVIDGSDCDGVSGCGVFGGPPFIENNYFANMANGIIANGQIRVSGNTVVNINTSFDSTAHMNGIEINASQDLEISNNIVAHLGTGTLGIWVAPYPGYTVTAFNNLIYDTDTGNVFDIAPAVYIAGQCTKGDGVYCTATGTTNAYNNTIECGPDSNPNSVCFAGIAVGTAAVTLKNNHLITNATTPNDGVWSLISGGETPVTESNNLIQSKATANGQGYNIDQTSPFSPTNTDNGTVDTGTSLSSLYGSFAALAYSSGIGVVYNATAHTVSYPKLAAILRSTTDIGAYEYQPPGAFQPGPGKRTGGTFTGSHR